MDDTSNILIIDDEPVMHTLLSEGLAEEGFKMSFAFTGEQALDMVRANRYQLVITDLVMPRFTGLDILKAIKQIDPEIEVIVMTGHGSVEVAVTAIKEGAFHFIEKPFNLRAVASLIQKALEKNRLKSVVTLYESSQAIFKNLNLDALLPITVHLAAEALGSDDASIMLMTKDNILEMAAVFGPVDDERWKARMALGDRVAGRVAKDKKPALITGPVEKDSRFGGTTSLRPVSSAIVVPLMMDSIVIGVLNINRKTIPEPFDAADLRIAGILSSHISQAIYNARLFSSLKDEKTRLATVFEQMTDAVVLTDDRGSILTFNNAARKILNVGVKSGETITEQLTQSQVQPALAAIMTSQDAVVHLKTIRETPKKLVLSGTASVLKLETLGFKPGLNGRLFVLRDVTEEEQEEVNKRSFLSLVSHKLRTPLSAISGYCDVLLKEPEVYLQEPGIKPLNTVMKHSGKMIELVEKLLNFVALEDLRMRGINQKSFAVAETINSSMRPITPWLESQKAAVKVDVKADETAFGDAYLIRDALKYLIENAVKFNPKPEKTVSIWIERKDGAVEINVKDNGPGIPPEDHDKIFTKFYQVDPDFTGQVEGWGLGLAFVKRVVDYHGGKLTLRSQLGEGTTVSFSLPNSSGAA